MIYGKDGNNIPEDGYDDSDQDKLAEQRAEEMGYWAAFDKGKREGKAEGYAKGYQEGLRTAMEKLGLVLDAEGRPRRKDKVNAAALLQPTPVENETANIFERYINSLEVK